MSGFESVGKYETANFSIKAASPMLGKRIRLKGLTPLKLSLGGGRKGRRLNLPSFYRGWARIPSRVCWKHILSQMWHLVGSRPVIRRVSRKLLGPRDAGSLPRRYSVSSRHALRPRECYSPSFPGPGLPPENNLVLSWSSADLKAFSM